MPERIGFLPVKSTHIPASPFNGDVRMNALKTAALLAALTITTSAAMAQNIGACPTGYAVKDGICPPLAMANQGSPSFGSTAASYTTAMKSEFPAVAGQCPPGKVLASWGSKKGCYPAH